VSTQQIENRPALLQFLDGLRITASLAVIVVGALAYLVRYSVVFYGAHRSFFEHLTARLFG
jgi:hypothetical protein